MVGTAWRACPKGTAAMLIRDRLAEVFRDEDFADLYPQDGRPALSPARLALVTVLQFTEHLSDRLAAEAVRTRLDWKYALGLALDDPGFDHSVLCEFRARLVAGDAAERVLNLMLRRLVEAGLLAARGKQRTDATHVLAAVRRVSRLELVGESMRAALEELARQDAGWLAPLIEPGWDKRYGHRVEIRKVPDGAAGVVALAETFGNDGRRLLTALWEPGAPPRLRRLRQVEILRQVWTHHFYWDATGSLRWRDGHELPPASLRFDSPYDTDAHYCVKNGTEWSGYRAHFTEACDPDLPEVVVHAAAAIAPVQDGTLLGQIHADLADLHLLPSEHLVDAAYPTPARIAHARQAHGVTLTGPLPTGSGRKAPPDPAFGKAAFAADWDTRQLTCPTGQTSLPWKTLTLNQRLYQQASFPATICRVCTERPRCTHSPTQPRTVTLQPTRELHEIQLNNWADQNTQERKRRYALRAGVEALHSQTVRTFGLRRSRYRGLPKTHLQTVLTAAACNLVRVADWIRAPVRAERGPTRFHTLCLDLELT
ncbi:IS1182 family transposase [Streptomyces prasinus]|uniref:IS1182 family transposase n=1 Tax=Streptomyces prasinus TaxID=67345 RepID=UPI0036BA3EC8